MIDYKFVENLADQCVDGTHEVNPCSVIPYPILPDDGFYINSYILKDRIIGYEFKFESDEIDSILIKCISIYIDKVISKFSEHGVISSFTDDLLGVAHTIYHKNYKYTAIPFRY